AHAGTRADRLLHRPLLLLADQRLHAVRARLRRPRGGAARDRLLPRPAARGAARVSGLPILPRARAGGLRVRLELRLLPAGLHAPRAGSAGISTSRRSMWPLSRGYPGRIPVSTDTDRAHLARAIELARRGTGAVRPNPVVGAVIARGEEVLGEGWHSEYGGAHAEVNAIEACGLADLSGATLY